MPQGAAIPTIDPRVDHYIACAAPFARPVLTQLRGVMHAACPGLHETIKWGMPFFMLGDRILAHMAAFKQHCAFEFWRGRRREAAERGKGDEAMGQFGRITSIADVPARRELLRIVKQAIAQAEAPPSAPRKPRLAAPKPAATGAPIETSALLQERNFGDLRGLAYDDLSVNPLTMREAPPGGESAEAFQRRVALAFGLMVKRRAALGGTLAVVTHGLVIRALLGTHLRMPDATPVPAHLGNTSVSIVEARPPHRVTLLDCTSHLDAGSLDDANALSGG